MMKESNGILKKAAQWAAIISCLVAVLSYMGINPFITKDTSNKDTVVLNDNSKSDKENTIINKPLDEQDYQNKQEYDDIITLETAKNMSIGEILLIPLKKHEKANYFDLLGDKTFLGVGVFIFFYSPFILLLLISFLYSDVFHIDCIKKSIQDIINVLMWILTIIIFIIYIYYLLVFGGRL